MPRFDPDFTDTLVYATDAPLVDAAGGIWVGFGDADNIDRFTVNAAGQVQVGYGIETLERTAVAHLMPSADINVAHNLAQVGGFIPSAETGFRFWYLIAFLLIDQNNFFAVAHDEVVNGRCLVKMEGGTITKIAAYSQPLVTNWTRVIVETADDATTIHVFSYSTTDNTYEKRAQYTLTEAEMDAFLGGHVGVDPTAAPGRYLGFVRQRSVGGGYVEGNDATYEKHGLLHATTYPSDEQAAGFLAKARAQHARGNVFEFIDEPPTIMEELTLSGTTPVVRHPGTLKNVSPPTFVRAWSDGQSGNVYDPVGDQILAIADGGHLASNRNGIYAFKRALMRHAILVRCSVDTFFVPPDIVPNGYTVTDTAWTKGTGWTHNGTSKVYSHATGTASDLSQAITTFAGGTSFVEGSSYRLTYTLTRTAGSITPKIGGASGTARSAGGTFTETIVAGADGTIAFSAEDIFVGTVTGVSINPFSTGITLAENVSVGDLEFDVDVPAGGYLRLPVGLMLDMPGDTARMLCVGAAVNVVGPATTTVALESDAHQKIRKAATSGAAYDPAFQVESWPTGPTRLGGAFRPASCHNYGGSAYLPNEDKILVMSRAPYASSGQQGGVAGATAGDTNATVYEYDCATGAIAERADTNIAYVAPGQFLRTDADYPNTVWHVTEQSATLRRIDRAAAPASFETSNNLGHTTTNVLWGTLLQVGRMLFRPCDDGYFVYAIPDDDVANASVLGGGKMTALMPALGGTKFGNWGHALRQTPGGKREIWSWDGATGINVIDASSDDIAEWTAVYTNYTAETYQPTGGSSGGIFMDNFHYFADSDAFLAYTGGSPTANHEFANHPIVIVPADWEDPAPPGISHYRRQLMM